MEQVTSIAERHPPAAHVFGWDCVEFWVGNARTTAGFLMSAFGFRCTGYAGPETGVRTKASYVLEQGDIRFVVSGALAADSPIADHVHKHGDGVHDLAWLVDDARAAHAAAVARGARSVRDPWVETDDTGALELAQVAAYGDTVHTFVNRARYRGTLIEPGYTAENLPNPTVGPEVGLRAIDHVVGNVEQGRLDDWVHFYSDVLGFSELLHFDESQIRTEYSALISTVVWDGAKIVMPINEPADGLRKSQIQEYIEHYDGPGVQHIALRTDDIVTSVQALRDRGVRFMQVPDTYYDEARVLAERDPDGYLLRSSPRLPSGRSSRSSSVTARPASAKATSRHFEARPQTLAARRLPGCRSFTETTSPIGPLPCSFDDHDTNLRL